MSQGRADTLVLCYHAVSADWSADLSVTAESLEAQLRQLLRRGYRGVTFSEAAAGGQGRRMAITFDDAYRSTREHAFPILSRLGLPATVFVPTAHVGTGKPMVWPGIDQWLGGPHERELHCMDVEDLVELRAAGWEIGAHTHTHPHLTQLQPEELEAELSRPRVLLEEWLGEPCQTLAYPYGDVSQEVAAATRAAGYRAAATLDANRPPGDPMLWPRVGVYHPDALWRFRLKWTPAVRRLRLARLRHPLSSRSLRSD